jgi:NADP-dependent 3-hydroxy acid dehydrogenase YdfG
VSKLFDLRRKDGASGGLGRHFAGVVASAGAVLSLGARRADALAETVRTVGVDRAQGLFMDVTDAASIERAFDDAEARFGLVTVLINNAGVAVTRAAIDIDEKAWSACRRRPCALRRVQGGGRSAH